MRPDAYKLISWITMAISVAVLPDVARAQTAITESGVTSFNKAFTRGSVDVRVRTVRADRNSDAFPIGEGLDGVKAVTLIRALEISIDRKSVFVYRSVFADLVDPRAASLEFEKGDFVLIISGGDASESYFVRIYFDGASVKRRLFYSTLTPQRPTEDTRYRLVVLKDE